MNILQKYRKNFDKNNEKLEIYNHIYPKIVCNDGFSFSVQASPTHYCSPKENLEDHNYSHWEIGFPSRIESELLPYIEDENFPLDTVYSYVPTDIIISIINKHGGIKNG